MVAKVEGAMETSIANLRTFEYSVSKIKRVVRIMRLDLQIFKPVAAAATNNSTTAVDIVSKRLTRPLAPVKKIFSGIPYRSLSQTMLESS